MTHRPTLVYGRAGEMEKYIRIWEKMPYWYTNPKTGKKDAAYLRFRKVELYDLFFPEIIGDQVRQDLNSFEYTPHRWSGTHHKVTPMHVNLVFAIIAPFLRLFHITVPKPMPVYKKYDVQYPTTPVGEEKRPPLNTLWLQMGISGHWMWMKALGETGDHIDEEGTEWV